LIVLFIRVFNTEENKSAWSLRTFMPYPLMRLLKYYVA